MNDKSNFSLISTDYIKKSAKRRRPAGTWVYTFNITPIFTLEETMSLILP